MERLTGRFESGLVCVPKGMMPEALNLLAAYEDTGKTPEEVLAMTNKLAELQAFVQNWHEGENV